MFCDMRFNLFKNNAYELAFKTNEFQLEYLIFKYNEKKIKKGTLKTRFINIESLMSSII